MSAQQLIRDAIVAPHVKEYAARLVLATHPEGEHAVNATNKYVRCGASPRAAQALLLGAKVKAVTDGRFHVSFKDIADVAYLSLRHRLILNFEAEADRVSQDEIVKQILDATPKEPVKV
jgi:MoxR-like ATPase